MTVDQRTMDAALIISALAALVWLAFTVRILFALIRGDERRAPILVMPVVGALAALALSAGAMSLAELVGYWKVIVHPNDLTVVANMGRGGLLMGGIYALLYYRPSGRLPPPRHPKVRRTDHYISSKRD